jgi:hypothetical protein
MRRDELLARVNDGWVDKAFEKRELVAVRKNDLSETLPVERAAANAAGNNSPIFLTRPPPGP